jgi:branched-chain amino acid transport system permease protein
MAQAIEPVARAETPPDGLGGALRREWPLLVLLALLLIVPPLIPGGIGRFFLGQLIGVFILAIYAMSYDLLIGYTGIVSFGHALFFGIGAYLTADALKQGWLPFAAIPLAVVLLAAAVALVIGALSLRVKGVYFSMVTLAFAEVVFIIVRGTERLGLENGLFGLEVPAWIDPNTQRLTFYVVTLAFTVLAYLFLRMVVASPAGHVLVAIRENEQRALALGYNTLIYKLMATVIAGVLAALAGWLSALFYLSVSPAALAVGTTINALLIVIIGGVGTLIGPALGAALYTLIGYVLQNQFARWQLVFGIVYVLLVLFVPYGLAGTWRRRQRQRIQQLVGMLGDADRPAPPPADEAAAEVSAREPAPRDGN